jgi:hypothetical protein
MRKKVLILTLSADFPPYDKMIYTAQETWDSIDVPGCETVFYCGESSKPNTDKIIYLPVKESLHTMGEKLLLAFEWALKNKEFDYIARPHSCIYVNKKELINYIRELPDENVFAGLRVVSEKSWIWGGSGLIFSKDVVRKLADHQNEFQNGYMEDIGLSYLATKLGIPFTDGRGCSIDKMGERWICLSYGTNSFEFSDFSEITKSKGQFMYRVKQDYDRNQDEYVMRQLFKYLQ